MLTVHRAAIRGEAARFYSAEIIDDWGPLPIRAENVGGLADRMIRGEEEAVVARDDATGRVVGFGSIVPAAEELRAVYVAPDHQRSGIGSMIVAELEARARKHGLSNLSMDASINSERFYRHHGFEVEGRGEHVLNSGRRMACVRMRKLLGTDC